MMKLVILILLAAFGWFIFHEENDWIFMSCSSTMEYGVQCRETDYEIPGYKTPKECMLDGLERFSKNGFECGLNCTKTSYGANVCKKICNKNGCSE